MKESNQGLSLLQMISTQGLLGALVQQLTKDARQAGLSFYCDEHASAEKLVQHTYEFLLHLILQDFGSYLNFLYRVDVPEQQLLSLTVTEPKQIARQVSILVLKREWQKVSFRNKSR